MPVTGGPDQVVTITIAQSPFTIILQLPRTHSQSYYNCPEPIHNHITIIYNHITIAQNPFTIISQLPRIHSQSYYNHSQLYHNLSQYYCAHITTPLDLITMLSLKVVILYTLLLGQLPYYCD
jgi:hypothetical protein